MDTIFTLKGSPAVCSFTLRGSPGVGNFTLRGHLVYAVLH